jgi:hypothetical protein
LVVFIARGFPESLCKFFLKRVLYGVAIESQFAELLGEGFDIVWMAMSDADDCMPSVEVKVFLSFVVPDVTALSFIYGDVE